MGTDLRPARSNRTNGRQQDNFPLTDTGLAERFALQHGDSVRYCHKWAKWLVWDDTRWKIDDQARVDQLGKDTVRSILHEAYTETDDYRRKEIVTFARSAESVGRHNAMLTLARSEAPLPISPEALDQNRWIFNCPNGRIDLCHGKLCEHRREDLITKLCPVAYLPDAVCPTWLNALDRIFAGNQELIQWLQRFVGYCLTGDVSEQVLPIWWGTGANGKSTVANAIMEVLGPDYSMKASSDLLLQKPGESHPTGLTDLAGKLLVACIETDEGRRLDETMVKELTGGDPIRARRMREDYWQFDPSHKVILACNHKPVVRGTDNAIWRRLRMVPFTVTFSGHERDKDLPAKLRAELPGILAWAVRGCLDWQRDGLGHPAAVVEATAVYQDAENVLLNFLNEACVTGPDTKVKASDLVDAYREWSGDKSMTVRTLTRLLEERGIERYTNNGTWYRGVGMLDGRNSNERAGEGNDCPI